MLTGHLDLNSETLIENVYSYHSIINRHGVGVINRALDKREYLVIIRDRLVETVQRRGHNKCFYAELRKIIHEGSQHMVSMRKK